MQSFDAIALVLLVMTVFGLGSVRIDLRWTGALLCFAVVSILLHGLFEGIRWQMVPAYLVLVVLGTRFAICFRDSRRSRRRLKGSKIVRYFGDTVLIGLLLFSCGLSVAFPMFDLPTPDGDYAIGTIQLYAVDEQRSELYSPDSEDKRALRLRVWYPADTTQQNSRIRYWDHPVARSSAVTRQTPLPWFTFTHLGQIRTHSYLKAPVATGESSYPVILYSHGVGIGWASSNTKIAEGLASHGYIVVGIDHAYIGSMSVFPDGRTIEHSSKIASAMSSPPPEEVSELQERLRSTHQWREQVALYEKAMTLMPKNALHEVYTALDVQVKDQQFVLDELAKLKMQGSTPFLARADLDRVGIFGMSLGGSAAFETCLLDMRCKAGANLDGFHPKHIGLAMDRTPFLYVNSSENLLFNSNFQLADAPAYSVIIDDVTHFNFFDFAMMSPLYKVMGVLGDTDGFRGLMMIEESLRWFFDKHLKERQQAEANHLLEKYPEVMFDQR